ncbi:lipoyl(octanoyl) transferase LipB [Desulfobacula sp.]
MPEGIKKKRSAVFIDLGILEYKRALDLQLQILHSKINLPSTDDRLFFVEHPAVFTLGKRGGQENLGVSKDFLRTKGIDVVKTDRGGNITYHCPGQAVLYPVIDLEKNKIHVKDFVHGLEEIMKLTAQDFDVSADRDERNHGLWVGDSKIGSVGLAIKKGISIHGLAMNINPDLDPFSWINPCGLTNVSMTSIENEIKKNSSANDEKINLDLPYCDLSMTRIKKSFQRHFSSVFNYSILN